MSSFSQFLHSALVFEQCTNLVGVNLTTRLDQTTCLTVSSSNFYQCKTLSNGGAINFEGHELTSTLDVQDRCEFRGCESNRSGGAIYAWVDRQSATVRVNLAHFYQCRANGSGGCIYVRSREPVNLSCNSMHGGSSGEDGGGICALGGVVNISFCIFTDCDAERLGGGLNATAESPSPPLTVVHANFTNCHAGVGAWAIMLGGFSFELNWTIFDGIRHQDNYSDQEWVRVEAQSARLDGCKIISAYFVYWDEDLGDRDFGFIRGDFTYAPGTEGILCWHPTHGSINQFFSPPLAVDEGDLKLWPLEEWVEKTGWQDVWPQDTAPPGGGQAASPTETWPMTTVQPTGTGNGTQEEAPGPTAGSGAGLGTAAIAFIVIACVLFVAIIIVVVWLFMRKAECCQAVGSDGQNVKYF